MTTHVHCVKSVQIRNFFGPYFPIFRLNAGKYGPEKTPYLDTFHAVVVLYTHIAQLMTHTKNVYVAATAYLAIMLLRL